MTPRRVLLGAIGLALVLLALGAIYLTLYLDRNRALVESAASQALGREVRIDKGIALHWSMSPTIALNGLWIGKPESAVGDYLLRAEHAYVQLDIAALLQRRLAVKRLLLRGADIAIETGEGGKGNWSLGDPASSDGLPRIDRLVIEDSRLRLQTAAGSIHEFMIANLQLSGLAGGTPSLRGDFEIDEVPLALSSQIDAGTVSGLTEGDRSGRYVVFEDLRAKIAGHDFTGRVRIPLDHNKAIDIVLRSETADISPMLSPIRLRVGKTGALLQRELPPLALPARAIELDLAVARLRAEQLQVEGVQLKATLVDGAIEFALADQANNLDVTGELEPSGPAWALNLRNESKIDLGLLIDGEQDREQPSQGTVTLDVALAGSGQSLGSLLGSARGHINLDVGSGRLSDRVSRYIPLGSLLTTLLQTIHDRDQPAARAKLECAVLHFDVNNGIATSDKGLALRTDRVNMLGAGSIKLVDGAIDLRFKTAQRQGLGLNVSSLADSLIGLTGTLQEPQVKVDVEQAVLRGGVALATGGGSSIGEALFKRLSALSNPCETVMGGE